MSEQPPASPSPASALKSFRGEERDWTQQYAAIGEFVVEFEQICFWLRHTSCGLLQHHGLEKWKLAEIIFNQRAFTAEPLFQCFASMVAELLGPKHEILPELDALRKRHQEICEMRNKLVHGTHLIGPDVNEVTDKETPMEMHTEKRTPDKKGARVEVIATTIAEVKAEAEEARALKRDLIKFCGKMMVALPKPKWYVDQVSTSKPAQ